MKKHRNFVAAAAATTGLAVGGLTFAAPAAHASEPLVDLGEIVHGEAEFSADVSEFSRASLKTKSGQKIYLNIQVKPMTRKQIKPGTCRTAPVGKHFFNEMVDPATGNHYYKPWRVQAGDNIFCMDHAGDWRKKSCGNKAKGIFGVPKPPKSKIRVKGVVRDFLAASGKIAGEGELEGHASAHVVQYDDNGRKVCEASATVEGRGWGMFEAWIKVRSRSMVSFSAEAERQVKAKLRSNTQIRGTLVGRLKLSIEGNAMAMCDVAPPPPPTDECPDIPGDQPPGTDCEPDSSIVSVEQPNDVLWGNTRTIRVTGVVPAGQTATLKSSAGIGSIATSDRSMTVSGDFDVLVHYTAPTEGTSDTFTVKLYSQSGHLDDEASVTFGLTAPPPDPLKQ